MDSEVCKALDEIIEYARNEMKEGTATRRSVEHIIEVAERLKNRQGE